MKHIYDAIIAARSDSSKLVKQALLNALKDDISAQGFFHAVYEPRINYYVTKVDTAIGETLDHPWKFDLSLITSIHDRLATRKLTGNAAKKWLADCYAELDTEWERELLIMLIERDVRAGFSANTINKVWPGLITDVPYMRCSLPKDTKLSEWPWANGIYSQIKADGMFANVTHDESGDVTIESRNGSPFPIDAFGPLIAEVKAKVPEGYQLHGELTIIQAGKTLPRQEGNGILNKLLQGGELPENTGIIFDAWDLIPAESAVAKGKYDVPYSERFSRLEDLIGASVRFSSAPHYLQLIEYEVVYSLKEAYEHYKGALARGLEGVIVKHPRMIWKDTTSKDQVKLKLEFECDLKITGFNEGRGKYVGKLGSFQMESSDGLLKVNVAGLTDAQRKEYWDDREQLLAKIATVKSNSIMPPTRSEDYSLFLPILVEIRLDKREADSLERIQEQYEAAIESVAE